MVSTGRLGPMFPASLVLMPHYQLTPMAPWRFLYNPLAEEKKKNDLIMVRSAQYVGVS